MSSFSYTLSKVRKISEEAISNPEKFWAEKSNYIEWFERPKKIIEGEFPNFKWFVGGYSNISYNAVDRHLPYLGNQVAFYWTNEKGETKTISYYDLYYEVNRATYVLKELGVKRGDSVSLLMPNIPESVYFGLAVHRLGAILVIHYVGLSDESLAYRIKDCNSKVLITASKTIRAGNEIRIKDIIDRVLNNHTTPIEKVIVIKRGYDDFNVNSTRDIVYEDIAPKGKVFIEPIPVESNEPGTIYYTSGTTGRPKGIYHTQLGYIIGLNWAFRGLFSPKRGEVWWTLSELGWPVWPMANLYTIPVMGLTGVLFEGYIGSKRELFSRIIERFSVNILWSSTTTLYTIKGLGEEAVRAGDTKTLRIILNTGEPLNVGAWKWLSENLPNTVIADAYWMTEHLIPIAATPFGIGEIPFKPGSAGVTFPGSKYLIVDDDGKPLPPRQKGYIVLKSIQPAFGKMWNDPDGSRYYNSYLSRFPGYFYTGDFGFMDEDGYIYVLGRADDVIKEHGERIGTLEIENIIATHPSVAEVAVAGMPFEKGEKIIAFVVTKSGIEHSELLANDIKNFARNAGFIVDKIIFVEKLPKTKSGKIMRRLLRALLRNEPLGDITTLDDTRSVEIIKEALKKVNE
jgi:acetyl-CoA synthetase